MPSDATSWRTRIAQLLAGLRAAPDPTEAEIVERYLTPATQPLLARLPAHDRRHLVQVALKLERRDPTNHDLILAGLLHDIGKADETGTVRMIDRVAKVSLERFAPRLLARLTQRGHARLLHGLYLAAQHADLGAALAEQAACSQRTVWLIKNHETSGIADNDLRTLMVVDQTTP